MRTNPKDNSFRTSLSLSFHVMVIGDLRQVGCFLRFHPPINWPHDVTEILLKVALSTMTTTTATYLCEFYQIVSNYITLKSNLEMSDNFPIRCL